MDSHTTLNKYTCNWKASIHDIYEDDWKKIFGNSIIRGIQFFKAIQDSDFEEIEYQYLQIFEQGNIISIIPCFTYKLNLIDILAEKTSKYYINQIRKLFPNFGFYKLLVIGSYTATCEHFVEIIPKLNNEEKSNVIKIINTQLELKRDELKCKLIFVKDIRRKHVDYVRSILPFDYYFFNTFPTTLIPICNDFPYPSALRKKNRKRYSKFVRLFDNSFDWEIVTDFSEYTLILYELYLNVLERAKNKFEVLNETFFKNLNSYFGEKSFLIIARDKQKDIRLIEIILEEDDRLLPLYLGIKYLTDDTKVLYLNVIFKTIEIAQNKKNMSLVEFGQTSYYPKIMSGALVEELCYGFYSHNPIMKYIIKHFFKYIFTPTQIPGNVYLKAQIETIKSQLQQQGFEIIND